MFKNLVQKILEFCVRQYLKKHSPKLVVVVGSVGKTSTKLAIATVLGEKCRIRTEQNNHNTNMSVPLGVLGIKYPDDVHSISSWLQVFWAAWQRIKGPSDVDVIVQELGTDHPGDIAVFGTYLNPDIAVVTGVSPEHMEFFGSVEAVATEELSVAKFAKLTIVNRDDVDARYANLADTHAIDTYGLSPEAEYHIELDEGSPLDGRMGRFYSPEGEPISVNVQLVGDHSIKAAVAAGAVARKLGLTTQQIAIGIAKVVPVAGRMSPLLGVKESIIIDDSYNSSPLAAVAAIQTLYKINAPQRIAILGSMNELGSYSAEGHKVVAEVCDPNKLEWVVTVGGEAERFLAPPALAKGCQVKSFDSAYDAGGFVHGILRERAVILVKGSQNAVFTEEAVKVLLHDADDEKKLVRQESQWMDKKRQFFDLSGTLGATEDV